MIPYDVVVKRVSSAWVLATTIEVAGDEGIGEAQRQVWPRLQRVLEQVGHRFAAPSIAQEVGSNPIQMTLALPVQEAVEIHVNDISTRELPGLRNAACTVIHGDPNYDEAFGAIFKWIEESGQRPGNEQREVYLDCDGPRNTWVLELQVALLPKEP